MGKLGNLLVLTGAGCSTASGIPDYRDPNGRWKHNQPIRYQAFVGNVRARQRYWARSLIGWRRVERALPNPTHRALEAMEREAAERGIPIAIINRGQTRADELAAHKLDAEVGGSLLGLAAVLGIEVSERRPFRQHLSAEGSRGGPVAKSSAPQTTA